MKIKGGKMIIQQQALGFPWPTLDPFLFCVFHQDFYPKGDGKGAPVESLSGRQLGQDFVIKDGWRMYHGETVPGFPAHPHRGFETVTCVNKGWVDHADSLGGKGRYGNGDVQWMTAGKGIQHSEMFPLLNTDKENPMELFQIWLNLPAKNKMVDPEYKMLWHDEIIKEQLQDDNGFVVNCVWYCGNLNDNKHLSAKPPKNSWAFDVENEVVIGTIELAENAHWCLPSSDLGDELKRCVYFFEGDEIQLESSSEQVSLNQHQMFQLDASKQINIINKGQACRLLILQGKAIGEPVAHHGPFVMNTQKELQQAFSDYQRTQFGGWPFDRHDVVHDLSKEKFAV
jgi:quercetin 2,3-dioxygenase